MARIKRAGRHFFNFFRGEELLPAEFREHHELQNFDKIQNTDFYINF